jgi:sugar/nucleoside kinase (ribokinase family)
LDVGTHPGITAATFGALLYSLDTPKSIGLIVKAGHDFPSTLEQTFEQWNVDLHIMRESKTSSSRGRILYGQSPSERTYQRLTSPLPSTVVDLAATSMISAACFHFFDIPETVNAQINEIMASRVQQGMHVRPLYVWEPQAKSCSPQSFEQHKAVAEKVDIFSPNHAELSLFFTLSSNSAVVFEKAIVEEQARAFMPNSPSHPLCILIRCAEHGCFVLSKSSGREQSVWFPAFHLPGSDSVVDPTGAGNAFLGGAAMGYLQHGDFEVAAMKGSVAASFAVERVGLPDIVACDVEARFEEFAQRLLGSEHRSWPRHVHQRVSMN